MGRKRRMVDRSLEERFDHLKRRLPRLDHTDPAAVSAAHRRAGGIFWSTLAMQRHASRITDFGRREPALPESAATGLGYVALLDAVLDHCGSVWTQAPDGWIRDESDWAAHVQWGADQYVETCRHLGGRRWTAAAVTSRAQLERWTINLALAQDIEPFDSETNVQWIDRVWSVYPSVGAAGRDWARLSEIIHGRGVSLSTLRVNREIARAGRTLERESDELATMDEVIRIAQHTLVQVRACAGLVAENASRPDWARLLAHEGTAPITTLLPAEDVFVIPMDHAFAFSGHANGLISTGMKYRELLRRTVENGTLPLLLGGHLAAMTMAERRGRAIERYRHGARFEARMVGDEMDIDNLHGRLFRYIAISEATEIVSAWQEDEAQERALLWAADGLRSAMHLWLEDTDLSLPAIRVVLEQTCVARAWRLKPAKARRTAALRAGAGTRRWLEISGWRRASSLGTALGEFSHVSLRARTGGARELLTRLQRTDSGQSIYTARGHALEATAYLLAQEVAERLEVFDVDLARGFREEVTLLSDDEHERETEDLLQRALVLREFDLDAAPMSERFADNAE